MYFLIPVTKYLIKVTKGRRAYCSQFGDAVHTEGKAWLQELKALGHVYVVKMQKGRDEC